MKKQSWTFELYLLVFVFFFLSSVTILISGCGSNGGNTSGSDETTPRLFFMGNSLWAVDPANPKSPVLIIEEDITEWVPLVQGTWDSKQKRFIDPYINGIAYRKGDSELFKISALNSDPLFPSQVSNDSLKDLISANCSTRAWIIDFANTDNSVFFYRIGLPTNTSSCGTLDPWNVIKLGMNSHQSPLNFSKSGIGTGFFSETVIPLRSLTNGSIVGWLAREAQDLIRCDHNFQNCSTVTTFTGNIRSLNFFVSPFLTTTPFTDVSILKIDKSLHVYNSSTGTLSNSLHTFGEEDCVFSLSFFCFAFSDGEYVYLFEDEKTIRIFPLAPGISTPVFHKEEGNITNFLLTNNMLVYKVSSNDSPPQNTLKAIGKKDGVVTTLIPPTEAFLFPEISLGDRIFYNKGGILGAINEDGTGVSEFTNSLFAGKVYKASVDWKGLGDVRFLLMEGCSSTTCAGATLKSFDATTESDTVFLGSLPLDISSMTFIAIGEHVLGTGRNSNGSSDIFYVKPDQTDSLARITNTDAINENPIFPIF